MTPVLGLSLFLLLGGLVFAGLFFLFRMFERATVSAPGRIGTAAHRSIATLLHTDPFWNHLDPRERRIFAARLKDFIDDKEWEGRGIEVTKEMRLRIGAVAVQITFGLEPLLLMQFKRIIVYPDAYRDRRSRQLHKGGTAPLSGLILLSWKHFVSGEADRTDAVNLGLHEMAHALWFANRIGNVETDFLDRRALAEWDRLALVEVEMIRAGHSRLFRSYAGTNEAEFFACAVEYFFEQPQAFRAQMPAEYDTLRNLLKQDPAARFDGPMPTA